MPKFKNSSETFWVIFKHFVGYKSASKMIFDFGIFVLLRVTSLVTLFDHKLQVLKNSPKWTIFCIFNELLSTQNVNVARFARNVEWYFLLFSFYFRHDLESTTDRTLAVVTSLATVLNRTFQTRSSSASSIIDKCPQFVSKEKRQNRIFGKAGVNKKAVTRQRHNFELKQYFQIKYCNHSMELIWGVAPQAYQCTCKYFKWSQAF